LLDDDDDEGAVKLTDLVLPPSTRTTCCVKSPALSDVVLAVTNAKKTLRFPILNPGNVVLPPALTTFPPRAVNSESIVADDNDALGSTETNKVRVESLLKTVMLPVDLVLPPPPAKTADWAVTIKAAARR